MSRIAVFTQFFPPETSAGSRRVEALVAALCLAHDVTVITLEPGYPSSDLYPRSDVQKHDASFPGHIIRGKSFSPHHPRLIVRALREIGMAFRLTLRGMRVSSDAIVVSIPSMFLAPFAWVVARLHRDRFIIDLRDLTWRYVRETANPSTLNTFLSFLIERVMIHVLRNSDLILCTSTGFKEIMEDEYHVSKEKILIIMNGVSEDMLLLGNRQIVFRSSEQTVVTYIGLFGYNQGIGVLVDAARQLSDVRFLLIGDGPDKSEIQARIEKEKLTNISIIGYITSPEDLANYYQNSSILFVHVKESPVMKSSLIPAKIFEYMAFRKPIIYAGPGLAREFVEGIGCAITIPPDDAKAIVDAIVMLRKNPKLMVALGEKGRSFVEEKFQRKELMKRLVDELQTRFHI
jgi:glycosyltransferase involved in cell wall biosynthesis